jgi:predicted nucleic acid-binding Zn ribbon protein
MSRRDDDEPTIPCPYCGEEIHEDSQRCPRCGDYLSEEDRPPARKPWWIVAGVVVCLYLVYRWITGEPG